MNGMSTPLYEIALTSQDVSGQPLGQALANDRGPGTNGLYALLGQDTTPLPAGAQMIQHTEKVLTPHLWFNISMGSNGFSSLEQLQPGTGGTIQSLGGYRYLAPGGGSASYVEYNGAVYAGEYFPVGDVDRVQPAAYNRIAADFIAREQLIGLSQ
jgi:hypothetical protein